MANVLGIDITQDRIRAVLVRQSSRKHEVLRYLEVPISVMGEDGSRQVAVRMAYEELVASLEVHVDSVAAALPGQQVSLRTVSIPQAAAKRAAEVLPFELEAQLPFPVADAIIDHQPLSVVDGELEMLAAAIKEDTLEAAVAEFSAMGIEPRVMAPGATALETLPAPSNVDDGSDLGDTPWLAVHMEADHIDLCVLQDGRCALARTLDVGLDAAQHKPERLKQALAQSISMYRAQGGAALGSLVLCGSSADQSSLRDWLGGLLDLPAHAVQLPAVAEGGEVSPAFGKAYALAVRGTGKDKRLNLRKGRFALAANDGFFEQHRGLLTACAAALTLAYGFSVWAEYRVLDAEREQLAVQLEQVSKKQLGEETRSANRARALLERGAKRTDPLPSFDGLQALAAISAAIETGITHEARKLEILLDDGGGAGTFELQGSVSSLADRDTVASAIEEHPCLGEVEKGKTSATPGTTKKTYTLEGEIACPGSKSKSKKKKKKRRKG